MPPWPSAFPYLYHFSIIVNHHTKNAYLTTRRKHIIHTSESMSHCLITVHKGKFLHMCLCNCSKTAKKKRRALLTQKETTHAYSSVIEFQRLKIGRFKTAVLKNAWACYRCSLVTSSWFCPGCFCLSFTSRGGQRIKIAVTQMIKRYYCKQCILRHHDINDRT